MGIEENKTIIAFAEGCDEATVIAAYNLSTNDICKPVLMGSKDRIHRIAENKGIDLAMTNVDIIDHGMLTKDDLNM